jgi:hypothetical protein
MLIQNQIIFIMKRKEAFYYSTAGGSFISAARRDLGVDVSSCMLINVASRLQRRKIDAPDANSQVAAPKCAPAVKRRTVGERQFDELMDSPGRRHSARGVEKIQREANREERPATER